MSEKRERAFAAVVDHRDGGGFTLGVVTEYEYGYRPYTQAATWPTFEAAQEQAMRLNESMLGLTRRRASLIIASSMVEPRVVGR